MNVFSNRVKRISAHVMVGLICASLCIPAFKTAIAQDTGDFGYIPNDTVSTPPTNSNPKIQTQIDRAKVARDTAQKASEEATRSVNEIQGILNRGVDKDGKPLTAQQKQEAEQDLANAKGYASNVAGYATDANNAYNQALGATSEDQAKTAADAAATAAEKGQAELNNKVNNERDKAIKATNQDLAKSRQQSAIEDEKSCFSITHGLQWDICIKKLAAWIAYILFMLTSWTIAVAGMLFDFVLGYTVVNMKTHIDGISAINAGWVLFRDIGNMIFIFILIFIAIKTILGMDSGQTKRLLINVIIIGLLVNFSLFFTKFLIDISNILSIAFYHKIVNFNPNAPGPTHAIMQSLGLQALLSPQSFADSMATSDKDWVAILMTGVGGSIFIVIAAFAFLYAAVLFIIRYIALIFLLVLSPLPFFAYIFPSTWRDYGKKWLDALIGQLIFAPLFMLLLYLALAFTAATNGVSANQAAFARRSSQDALDRLRLAS